MEDQEGCHHCEALVTPLDALVRPLVQRCESGEIVRLSEWVAEMAKVPLAFQPGARFQYGYSIDVLGRVVEILGNKSLDQVLEERIFKPLGMGSTGFGASTEVAVGRLAALYKFKGGLDYGTRELKDDPLCSLWVSPKGPAPIYGGGGGVETLRGGLLSTVPDYMRFCLMLQRGGELDGARILHESTVRLMTEVNHLDAMGINTIWDGRGWGLLGSIELDNLETRDSPSSNPGTYGWGGWASTTFRVYPTAGVAYVFMTNCIDCVNYEELILRRLGEAIHRREDDGIAVSS